MNAVLQLSKYVSKWIYSDRWKEVNAAMAYRKSSSLIFFAAELCLSKYAFVEETGFDFVDFTMFTGTHQKKDIKI